MQNEPSALEQARMVRDRLTSNRFITGSMAAERTMAPQGARYIMGVFLHEDGRKPPRLLGYAKDKEEASRRLGNCVTILMHGGMYAKAHIVDLRPPATHSGIFDITV